MLQVLAVLLTSLMSIAWSTSAMAGDKYKGTWSDNGGHSTLEIRSETPLIINYCHNNRCNLHEPTGSVKSMKVKFAKNDNFPDATMKLKKSNEGYKGTYKVKGSKNTYKILMGK